MSLRIQIEGVNAFLEAIYGSGTRSSTILASLGCTPEQLQLPRVASVIYPYAETGHPLVPHAPAQEEIRAMADAVRASIAHRLGDTMCGHILFGSHGPRVDALLATYAPPHYGVLRALSIKRVMELLKDVRTNPVRG